MKIFITGGSGMVGRRLVQKIVARGDEAVVLTRDRQKAEAAGLTGPRIQVVKGDPGFPGSAWREAVVGCEAAVNLAGENILQRKWTDAHKTRIRESRINATRNLVAAIGGAPGGERPTVLVSASAVGIYGPRDDDEFLFEEAPLGNDFLAKLCNEWEEAARGASAHGARVVVLRIGIVLDPAGGALGSMLTPFKMFVGGPIGHGKQWWSWVHVDDVVGLILFTIDNQSLRGRVNAVAPNPVSNAEFSKELGAVLGRPSWLRVPPFALRFKFGEGADVLTTGQRVMPGAAERAGYKFRYPVLRDALMASFHPAG